MAGDMRIAIIGQDAFGGSVLDALVQAGETVVAVFLPPDREGRPPDPIKSAAQGHDIPVFQFRRMRNQTAIDAFKEVKADLCVMAFVTDIIPDAILEAPAKGTIQYHPSLLPKHRGPSSINWPIIYGETETGLTIFWPDKGLDTGPVLLQKTVAITSEDTLGSLYFDKLFPMGVDALVEAVELVAGGTAPRIVQDESQATYEGWCRTEDIPIDWSKPATEIFNRIRGGDPSPGAATTLNGQQVQFFRTELRTGAGGGEPGEVTEIAEDGFAVAAGDGTLFIRRVQPSGSGKVMAPEWVQSVGLKPGARFGN